MGFFSLFCPFRWRGAADEQNKNKPHDGESLSYADKQSSKTLSMRLKMTRHQRLFSSALNYFITSFSELEKAEKEKKALGLFGSGKVCYSDNLTGTEFKNIIKELR